MTHDTNRYCFQTEMIKELITNRTSVFNLPMTAARKPTKKNQGVWLVPPVNLRLESNEIHIWAARLDAENISKSERIISVDERARADRFRFEAHRNQFIAARGILRNLLGEYLQAEARELRFQYGEFGKPAIADEHLTGITFNISHSENLALFAVTREREIGVDIERINPSMVDAGTLSQCLTEQEKNYLYSLAVEKRNLFFFECWTRKEAYVKGCGKGLSLPVNEIETLSFTNSSMDFAEGGPGFRPSFWSLRSIPFIPGYAAALAVAEEGSRLRFWKYSDARLF